MASRYSESDRIFDELLLTRIQAGDRNAADRLSARWQPRLMRTAKRLLGDEDQARTAVQETWTGICKGWRNLRDRSRFAPWCYRILHNKCADLIRVNQKKRDFECAEAAEQLIVSGAEEKVSLDQAFARLSINHRIAATLYFAAGLTAKEISEATQVPLGTVKTRIFHARKRLKNMLTEPNKEGELK